MPLAHYHSMVLDQKVLDRLEKVEKEVTDIKKRMVDTDSIMTEKDYEALLSYRKEKESKKLVSHEQLKKKLGI